MSSIDKQALRGQSVEGSFYLAECGYCGQVMPSSKLRVLHSPDGEADCYCPHCNAEDSEIFDLGIVGSEVVNVWNYQQKRIEALLDELEAKDNRINRLEAIVAVAEQRNALMREWKRELKVPCDLVDDQLPVVIHGMVVRLEKLKETEAKLEAAEKRIAEFPGQKRLIGWRMADYTDETADPALAKNWATAVDVLPIFEGDVNTKLSAAAAGKGE